MKNLKKSNSRKLILIHKCKMNSNILITIINIKTLDTVPDSGCGA